MDKQLVNGQTERQTGRQMDGQMDATSMIVFKFSIKVVKYHDQKQLWMKGFILAYSSTSQAVTE